MTGTATGGRSSRKPRPDRPLPDRPDRPDRTGIRSRGHWTWHQRHTWQPGRKTNWNYGLETNWNYGLETNWNYGLGSGIKFVMKVELESYTPGSRLRRPRQEQEGPRPRRRLHPQEWREQGDQGRHQRRLRRHQGAGRLRRVRRDPADCSPPCRWTRGGVCRRGRGAYSGRWTCRSWRRRRRRPDWTSR